VRYEKSSTNILSDPLHWFGILVPPALREAQIEFAHGLENVLSLCNLNLEMEQLEIEIRRVRKRLGNQMVRAANGIESDQHCMDITG